MFNDNSHVPVTPYDEVDQNIVSLLKSINAFDGIFTTSSCGGHENPQPYQLPAGKWEVFMSLQSEENRPSLAAWLSIEHLAYIFSKRVGMCQLSVYSPAPFLNGLGSSISFVLEGEAPPDALAGQLGEFRVEFEEELKTCLEE